MVDSEIRLPNDPQALLRLVYDKAVAVYGDEEEADGFMNEMHGGGVAAAIGDDDDAGFVCPADKVRQSEAGARKVIAYLDKRMPA